jgi:O-antigen/teichoic acid export membrane protein
MRTKYAFKNMAMSMFSQIVIILLGFISRRIFLDILGTEYLGLNGLLTNILSAMVLIEGGIGISIVYNLYKPLAEDDKEKIIALIQLYKKSYRILALIVLCICIILYPFLDVLIKSENQVKDILVVYCIFVAKSIFSYLYAHKWALINADQKEYVLTRNILIFQVIGMVSKIVILLITSNYIFYILIEMGLFLVQNVINSRVVDKKYSYIKTHKKYEIDACTAKNIKINVKAMFMKNIGYYAITSTDNILISSFISLETVGLYSNYSMIISQLSALINPIIGSIGNGIGNLIATENNEKTYLIFNITYLVSFWVYSFAAIFLYNLLEPFINWWLGDGYLLGGLTLIVLLINFYINGVGSATNIFKIKAGLFAQDKYASIIEGIINLITSVLFIEYFGLDGIFIGTTLSYVALSFWNQPRIVFKVFFKKPLRDYFSKYIIFLGTGIGTWGITTLMCNNLLHGYSFIELIFRGIICIFVPNIIYVVLFSRTKEFKYLINVIKIQLFGSRFKNKY